VGEIIRRRVPAGRSAELRSSILALPLAAAVCPETLLNQLRWSLDCGACVPPEELLQAAVSSNVALDTATAARAAGAVRDEAFLPDARVQLAYSNYILGRPEAAASYLKSAQPLRYGRPSYLAALLAARLGRPGASPELRRQAAEDSGNEAGPAQGGPLWMQSPAAGMAAAIMNSSWDGQFPAFEARVRELADAAAALPEIRIPALSLLAELWTAQGRLVPGLRLDREAWQGAQSATVALPLVYEDLVERHCLNLIRAAEWDELAAVLDNYAARHPARLLFSGGMLHLMRGFSRLRQGRMPEGRAELLLGVEELLIADPLNVLPFAHSAAAYAAAAVGRHREADEQSRAFRKSVYREPRTLRLLAEAYCSAAELATGIDRGGRNGLVQLADEARQQGLRGVETDIRRLALGNGHTGSAQALAASSSAVEGPEARLLETFARAVGAADVTGLIGISDDALDAGHLLLALEAAQQAAGFLGHDPERRRLTGVQRRVHHRLVAAGMSPHMDIVRGEADSGLTVREAEILELVSGGSTNADIASGLGVSQRTVEGHLSRIFAKLGVTRRLELLDRARPS
jgi:DNA-binding CsgD family transcriptional regulator